MGILEFSPTSFNEPINVKPEGGPWAYFGHLTFQKNFWSKSLL